MRRSHSLPLLLCLPAGTGFALDISPILRSLDFEQELTRHLPGNLSRATLVQAQAELGSSPVVRGLLGVDFTFAHETVLPNVGPFRPFDVKLSTELGFDLDSNCNVRNVMLKEKGISAGNELQKKVVREAWPFVSDLAVKIIEEEVPPRLRQLEGISFLCGRKDSPREASPFTLRRESGNHAER